MANSIFERFGKNRQSSPMPGPFGKVSNMMDQFQAFKAQMQMSPDQAEAKVKELLNSGQMTQDQFNQLSNLANRFQSMFR